MTNKQTKLEPRDSGKIITVYVDSRTLEEKDSDNKKGYGTLTTASSMTNTEVRTALPVFIQPLAEAIRQAEQKTLDRVIEIIKEKGQQQDDGTIWVDMDDLLKSIKNP